MSWSALRICTIEDDAVDRLMIHRLLCQDPTWKVEFIEFTNGGEAIAQLPEVNADVVLLDSRIDRVEGGTVLQRIVDLGLDMPVIALTAPGEEAVAIALLRSGAIDTIPKSKISTSSLQRSITNAIEKQSLRTATERYRLELEALEALLAEERSRSETLRHALSESWSPALRDLAETIRSTVAAESETIAEASVERFISCASTCETLDATIDGLLGRAAPEGDAHGEAGVVDLESTWSEVCSARAGRLESANIALSSEPTLSPVWADRGGLARVLGQILDHAIETTPAGGSIHVEAVCEGTDEVTISVSDTGDGIAYEEQEDYFSEPADSETSHPSVRRESVRRESVRRESVRRESVRREFVSTKAWIEGQGGTLWVESVPGHGSVFRFTLPLSEPSLVTSA